MIRRYWEVPRVHVISVVCFARREPPWLHHDASDQVCVITPSARPPTGAGHPQLSLNRRERASTIARRGRVSVQVSVQRGYTPPIRGATNHPSRAPITRMYLRLPFRANSSVPRVPLAPAIYYPKRSV